MAFLWISALRRDGVAGLLLGLSLACAQSGSRRGAPATTDSGTGAAVTTDSGTSEAGSAPILPPLPAWVPYADDPSCQHAEVVESCSDGWCKIPAGCFVIGSPEDETGRGMYNETQTTVRLTHDFVIGQHEVTRAEWARTGWQLPQGTPAGETIAACDDMECPMTRMSWFATLLYANWLSEQASPALRPCYLLDGCSGTPEHAQSCTSVTVTSDSQTVYDCEGYRLPTEFEWEYAARSGTRTAYFAGPMSAAVALGGDLCIDEPALLDWAWYCRNAPGRRVQPVGSKGANYWGLRDVLGNAMEYVWNPPFTDLLLAPKTDPWGAADLRLTEPLTAQTRGSPSFTPPERTRIAGRRSWSRTGDHFTSFRLVRTLPAQ